ncbi:hypothetical protein DIPPA_32868 [Diplonema papillatum]|nr:hypothetical protein DIPPA_32868 [Diplonema papillatum]
MLADDDEYQPKRPTAEQRISDERDLIWSKVKNAEKSRWQELCSLPAVELFFTIQPLWALSCMGNPYPIPAPIASMIENDFVRKKTSLDIPASPALRFGRCAIDFTVGHFGQITLQQESGRDSRYGCAAYPPSGTFVLNRTERDESGDFFGAVVAYFVALFKYVMKKKAPCLRGDSGDGAEEVSQCRQACTQAFRKLHVQYAHILLTKKFTNSSHERGFYEFLYLATMRVLAKFFGLHKLRGLIEDVVNKLFRSEFFRFDFRKQQGEWDALAEYLRQTEWGTNDAECKDPDTMTDVLLSPVSARSTSSVANALERKFTQLVCPPKRISLKRAMQSKSMLFSFKYPDPRTTTDLLAEHSFRPRCKTPSLANRSQRSKPNTPGLSYSVPSSPPVVGSGINAARDRLRNTTSSLGSRSPQGSPAASYSRGLSPVPSSHPASYEYHREVEERLMPHDRFDDISMPLDVLADYFNDAKVSPSLL